MSAKQLSKSILITDLDNTLFDWFALWYYPFQAMLEKLEELSGISRDKLIPEIKEIHERHGTSEYAFLIEEIPSLRAKHPEKNLAELYQGAIAAFREARSRHMRLYPGVQHTLMALKEKGVIVAGYTESLAFYTNYRVRKLGLDGLLDYLYSPEDHDLPKGQLPADIRLYSQDTYTLKETKHHLTPPGELKPNPDILLTIIRDLKADAENCVYVGDSPLKDIQMANDAGVTSVLAKYGVATNNPGYELLRKVTHWTPTAVEKEKRETATPIHILENSFSELLELFQFKPHVNI